MLKVKLTVATFSHRTSPCIYQWVLIYLHTIVAYHFISSEFNIQVAGLKVKVTVGNYNYFLKNKKKKKKKLCRCSSSCIYQWILIYLHTIVGYYNISSKSNFQVAALKVKATVAILREKKKKKKRLCHRSSPCIYQWILI